MYKTYTFRKFVVSAVVLSLSLFTAGAFAGPGKPGNNPIKENGDIVEVAMEANALLGGEFDYLLGAVDCLTDEDGNNPVVDLLTARKKVTLFAPTNAAFEALQGALGIEDPDPSKTCEVDVAFGAGTLAAVLGYHVTQGRRFSNSVFDEDETKTIRMLTGDSITTTPSLSIIDGVPQVVNPVLPLIDINASNGVIHVIDTVMLPFNPFAGE